MSEFAELTPVEIRRRLSSLVDDPSDPDGERCLALLMQAIERFPTSATLHCLLGDVWTLFRFQPESRNVEFYEKAISLDPFSAEAYQSLAKLQFLQNRSNEAKKNFLEAYHLDATLAVMCELAEFFAAQGEFRAAQFWHDEARTVYSDAGRALRKLQKVILRKQNKTDT